MPSSPIVFSLGAIDFEPTKQLIGNPYLVFDVAKPRGQKQSADLLGFCTNLGVELENLTGLIPGSPEPVATR